MRESGRERESKDEARLHHQDSMTNVSQSPLFLWCSISSSSKGPSIRLHLFSALFFFCSLFLYSLTLIMMNATGPDTNKLHYRRCLCVFALFYAKKEHACNWYIALCVLLSNLRQPGREQMSTTLLTSPVTTSTSWCQLLLRTFFFFLSCVATFSFLPPCYFAPVRLFLVHEGKRERKRDKIEKY